MRKYRTGDAIIVQLPDGETAQGTLLNFSPCRRFVKVRLDDNCELLAETRMIKDINYAEEKMDTHP